MRASDIAHFQIARTGTPEGQDTDFILGVDPGIRGGAGIALVRDHDGALVFSEKVKRNDTVSTLQMMAQVRDRVRELIEGFGPVAVAREDHVFPGSIEKIARIILRRMNGILDMVFFDAGYLEKDALFHFPVNTWKALIGMPGDLGKEHKGNQPGQMPSAGRKKNTEASYLAAVNEYLGASHPDIDAADAHGVARAAWVVRSVGIGRMKLTDLPANSQKSLWDRKRAGGTTLNKALRTHPEIVGNPEALKKVLRVFVT